MLQEILFNAQILKKKEYFCCQKVQKVFSCPAFFFFQISSEKTNKKLKQKKIKKKSIPYTLLFLLKS